MKVLRGKPPRTFHRMSASQWHEVINTNLNACFNVTRPVIDGMRDRKWGRIVQISSINGLKGQYGQANYAAAKAGMHGFTISLARENAKLGITVNTVAPGRIDSAQIRRLHPTEEAKAAYIAQNIPAGYFGEPHDIGHLVAFLASPLARYINGAAIPGDGGAVRRG